MPETRSSGTATVLFTDLVGSTELMAQLGDAVFDDLRGEHFIRLREAVSACRGVEVKTTGDGMLVTFTSAVDALAAAVAAQQATDRHAARPGWRSPSGSASPSARWPWRTATSSAPRWWRRPD